MGPLHLNIEKKYKIGSRICKTVVLYLNKSDEALKYVQENMHKTWEGVDYIFYEKEVTVETEDFRCWELRR